VRELFKMYVDIATADPNDIVKTRVYCCRHCYGAGFGYQWKDANEWARAVDACGKNDRVPTDEGGFGFDPFLEPNLLCTECVGEGIKRVIITDTTKLTGKAKLLYKGAKQDRFGCIEVLLHDQDKAREQVGRMLGAFKDALDLRTPQQRADEETKHKLPANCTEDEAARAYLGMLN